MHRSCAREYCVSIVAPPFLPTLFLRDIKTAKPDKNPI